jgi:hypothetical protein
MSKRYRRSDGGRGNKLCTMTAPNTKVSRDDWSAINNHLNSPNRQRQLEMTGHKIHLANQRVTLARFSWDSEDGGQTK